jgi:dephospho-CoA kinase
MTVILGLTGSIGMGKSTVARMFEEEGVPVFDADAVVHHLQGPGGDLVAEIEARFPGTTGPAGVNRTTLAERVLGEPEALQNLEGLIHPIVAQERVAFLERHAGAPLVVLDLPLLFERGYQRQVAKVAVVSASADVQADRVLARPDMTCGKFAKILQLQMPDEEKRRRADFVIDTSGSLDATRAEVRRIVACLLGAGDS